MAALADEFGDETVLFPFGIERSKNGNGSHN
jgi:hypothetical protein